MAKEASGPCVVKKERSGGMWAVMVGGNVLNHRFFESDANGKAIAYNEFWRVAGGPDLLAACEAIAAVDMESEDWLDSDLLRDVRGKARAALKTAKGDQ